MAHLVLTVVGDDRAGLVQKLADVVAAHDGNWERSELAELAGAFAGIVLVEVPEDRREALVAGLQALDGLLHITPYAGAAPVAPAAGEQVTFTVLGNDRPGIVRDITQVLVGGGLTIDRFTSRTVAAPMSGGELFEATVSARARAGDAVTDAVAELEQLAGEIQVDLTLGGTMGADRLEG
ncbi:amino acid-binding ACT protein [Microbacterium protaetiae]|uniref:Amino acid-binding ACT protein n=1 Tax=Microbacterium protaetiae TaxID=2509458 RepID=A0A4P6EI98_9MICO|nr:ACT domain-containing protein [Microbacterium protaetiae]QAY61283.1 amino acid-binding ACT protein [Microbacterium protaetiae]